MKKLKITRISATNKKKDGSILTGKFGEFYRVGIQAEEYGDQWLNGFSNKPPTYEVGDVIEAEVTTEEFQGKEQLKFRIAKKEDVLEDRVTKLEKSVFGESEPVEEKTIEDEF